MESRNNQVRLACVICFCCDVILVSIALTTPNWIASDPRVYGAQFVKLGLWESCFRSFADPRDIYLTKYFAGCRWTFSEEYRQHSFVSYMEPGFFIVVQLFFVFCFMIILASLFLVVALLLCKPEKEVFTLKVLSLATTIAGLCSLISVITFASAANTSDWLPDPDHNFLSWSFGLAVVATFLLFVTSILFYAESRIIKHRQDKMSNRPTHVFTLSDKQQYSQSKA